MTGQVIEVQERYGRSDDRWRVRRYDLSQSRDIARYVARTRYAWPGGYELYALTKDSSVFCADCCQREYYSIAHGFDEVVRMFSDEGYDGSNSPPVCDVCGKNQ